MNGNRPITPRRFALAAGLLSCALALGAEDKPAAARAPAPFRTDFSKGPLDKPSLEVDLVNGDFVIKESGGERYLELPGTPLDTFSVIFGPEQVTGTEVHARVQGTSAGRLFPEFGVGSNGISGYKLWVRPGQNAVEIRFDSETEVVAKVEYKKWASGGWTSLRLRVAPHGEGKWRVQGKVWPSGTPEPEQWLITHETATAPEPGRATIWGQPYSDEPIRYDDLAVIPVVDPAR